MSCLCREIATDNRVDIKALEFSEVLGNGDKRTYCKEWEEKTMEAVKWA
jgi:hypothetical protein